jgi:hypothetical protein
LLIKLLLARSQGKRLATASAFNLLICHLELILLSLTFCLSSLSSAFTSAATVPIGLAGIPALFATPRIAHIALLVKLLFAGRENKCPLAICTFNLFIFHLGFLG